MAYEHIRFVINRQTQPLTMLESDSLFHFSLRDLWFCGTDGAIGESEQVLSDSSLEVFQPMALLLLTFETVYIYKA